HAAGCRRRSGGLAGRPDAPPRGGSALHTNLRDARLNDSGLAPRRAALGILLNVRRGMPFDNALTTGLVGLPENDRRLAHELAAGVLRQRDAPDAVLLPAVA